MPRQACYPDKAPEVDDLLDVLSHHLRREVIDYFENHAEGSVAPFADVVSHIEHRVPSELSEGISVKLLHVHLPKLEAADFLEYDGRTGQLRYHGRDEAGRWLGELQAVFAN